MSVSDLTPEQQQLLLKVKYPKRFRHLRLTFDGYQELEKLYTSGIIQNLDKINLDVFQKNAKNEKYKIIFGSRNNPYVKSDDRKELYQVNGIMKKNAMKAAAVMNSQMLEKHGEFFKIKHEDKNHRYLKFRDSELCPSESFYGDPIAAYNTAVAIDDRTLVTPYHALKGPDWSRSIVYGFWKDSSNDPLKVPEENVMKVVKWEKDEVYDLAYLKVDKDIKKEFIVNEYAEPEIGSPIYAAGYPGSTGKGLKLSLKVVDNAQVLDTRRGSDKYFEVDLDFYKGNSGSPIFFGNIFIGIFISVSEDHFVQPITGGCYMSYECKSACDYCNCLSADIIYKRRKYL